ncbi:MAG: hypothetical protein K0U41_07210 [Gammaproteobacteria bacterium]|nr:hypothetical protein [Gammaproteobacteria bacterium]
MNSSIITLSVCGEGLIWDSNKEDTAVKTSLLAVLSSIDALKAEVLSL